MIERYLRRTEKETKAQEFHFKVTNKQTDKNSKSATSRKKCT